MSEQAAPFGLSVTAADKFYDAIATSLDLPRFAGAAAGVRLDDPASLRAPKVL